MTTAKMTIPKKTRTYKAAVVICDTREPWPHPWKIAVGGRVAAVVRQKLDVGDFTVAGLENILMIERKSLSDLYKSLGKDRGRFIRMIQRADEKNIRERYLVVECDLSQLYQRFWFSKICPKAIRMTLVSLTTNFNIKVIFAGNAIDAGRFSKDIMEKMHQYAQDGKFGPIAGYTYGTTDE